MGYFQAVVLGVVQGLTEFLPVSSSAHLILARALLGWDAAELGLAFDVACHVGTLAAVVAYFRSDLAGLARAVPALLRAPVWPADAPGRRLRLIAIGTRSGSTSDVPVSSPIAAKKVHAIAPPIRISSTCGSRCSITSILPEILAPPRIATKGRAGFSSACPR